MVERMLAALRRQELVLRAGIGVGIYRCLHEWPVWFNDEVYHGSAVEFFAGPNFFMFLDIGKVVGLGIYVALCFTVDKSRKSDGLMIAPSLLCAAGFLAPFLIRRSRAADYHARRALRRWAWSRHALCSVD